jgi:hypothetical protein
MHWDTISFVINFDVYLKKADSEMELIYYHSHKFNHFLEIIHKIPSFDEYVNQNFSSSGRLSWLVKVVGYRSICC